MAKRIDFEGTTHEFPDDFTDSDIQKALVMAHPATKQPERSFGGELWNEIKSGPANLAKAGTAIQAGVLGALVDPVGQLKSGLSSLGTPIQQTATKAKESAQRGDYLGAARGAINTGINVALPGVGSSSEEAGAMYGRGEYGPATGKTLGMGANVALGIEGPNIVKGATQLPAKIKGLTRVDPRVAINRGLRPTPSDPGFPKRIPETVKAIKVANKGEIPEGITDGTLDIIPAAQAAIDEHQAALGQWVNRAKGVRVPGDSIVSATERAIPKLMWERDPAGARALVNEARDTFGGKTFSVEEFRDFLTTENADLSKFYSQNPSAQQNAVTAGVPKGIEVAQAKEIRNVLYNALDPEGAGAGPRAIQRKTGDLIEVRNAAQRRNNAIVAEQPLTPIGKVIDPIKGAIRAMLPWKATGAGIAFAEGSEGRSLPLIRRAFKAVGDEPANALPLPGEPLYPMGNPQRQLPAPDRVTPLPADTSSVRATPGMGQPLNPRRALPAPDLAPPAPPDASTVRGAPAMRQPPPPGRALPPASTIQVPPSPISRNQGTAIPSRTGVPTDASGIRSVRGEFPPNVYDDVSIQQFGKPFAALTAEQQSIIRSRPPAPLPPPSRRPPPLGPPGR